MCVFVLALYYIAPLSSVAKVVAQHDSSSLHWPLCCMLIINGLLWFAYGMVSTLLGERSCCSSRVVAWYDAALLLLQLTAGKMCCCCCLHTGLIIHALSSDSLHVTQHQHLG